MPLQRTKRARRRSPTAAKPAPRPPTLHARNRRYAGSTRAYVYSERSRMTRRLYTEEGLRRESAERDRWLGPSGSWGK